MNHAITLGGLLSALAIIAGVLLCAFGVLVAFAGGISDNPEAAGDASRTGCTCGLIGLALIAGGAWGLLS